jgi:hypothetical protein
LLHHRHHQGRVDTAREEGAERDVRDDPLTDDLAEERLQLVERLAVGSVD